MKKSGNWLRNLWEKFHAWIRRFMDGRYGMDKLNFTILWISVALAVIAIFLPRLVSLIFTVLAYILMVWAIFRALSTNTYRRYRENRRYLMLIDRFKDREHKYFDCPKCRQPVRVPRGKGKIAITCPKCMERFVRKT